MRISLGILLLLITATALADSDEAAKSLDTAKLEADAVEIGEIVLDKHDVFDLSNPSENNRLYRLANKYHIITKDRVIEKQLLLKPGDVYSKRLADESERILRRNSYLYDATITPVNRQDGKVDLLVTTRDVWTLVPTFGVSRKGGENKTTFGIEDINLLGRGQTLRLEREEDVDRDSTTFEFSDDQLGDNWWAADLSVADNSDGHSRFLSLIRPFYALDTRWSAGFSAFDDERVTAFYDLGDPAAQYARDRKFFSAFGGWSRGLRSDWVTRYTAGVVYDDSEFRPVTGGTLPSLVPADRELAYPFIGIQIVQDQFEKTRNKEQIAKTEDFFTGTQIGATLGWADESLGSDRDALVYSATYGRGFGALDGKALLVRAGASGRNPGVIRIGC